MIRLTCSLAIAAAVVTMLAVGVGRAEQVEIEAPPPRPAREPLVIPPGDHYQATRPSDADFYREAPRVRHDPAFVRPLSSRTETPTGTGRAGVAGWTAPNPPVGSAQVFRESSGWLSLGWAVEWGGPPPPAPPASR